VSQRPSPSIAEKVHLLLEQRRVIVGDRHPDRALVIGDTGTHVVTAWPEGVACDCDAGANTLLASCSHKTAAMVMWAERADSFSDRQQARPDPQAGVAQHREDATRDPQHPPAKIEAEIGRGS
jgi:hypothetical protein